VSSQFGFDARYECVLLDSGLAESSLICYERVVPLSTGLGVVSLALTLQVSRPLKSWLLINATEKLQK
jgi:hypothetical protein